jgi:hypothetical protein
MDKHTIQEIELLTKQIQKELKKPQKKIDMNKVKELQHRILELENLKPTAPEHIHNMIENLTIKAESEKQSLAAKTPIRKRSAWKKIAIPAICFVFLMFSAFSITAIAVGGFDEAWVNISAYVKELFRLPSGRYETDEIILIKGNKSKRFDSVEELLKAEDLHILYPSELPDDIQLKKVTFISSEDKIYINLNYDPSDFSILIAPIEKRINDPDHLQKINGLECYVYHMNEKYQAIFYYDNREYTVAHTNYDELVEIVSNLTLFK